jgi:hypothetical protein
VQLGEELDAIFSREQLIHYTAEMIRRLRLMAKMYENKCKINKMAKTKIVKKILKKLRKSCRKVVEKLSKGEKKLSKSFPKAVKSVQKVAKKLSKSAF